MQMVVESCIHKRARTVILGYRKELPISLMSNLVAHCSGTRAMFDVAGIQRCMQR